MNILIQNMIDIFFVERREKKKIRTRNARTPSFVVNVANLSNCFNRATKSDIHCIALIRGGTRYFFHVDGVIPLDRLLRRSRVWFAFYCHRKRIEYRLDLDELHEED